MKFVYTVPSSVGSFFYLRVYDSTLVTNGGSITSTATGADADLRHGAISWAPRSVRCGPWPDTSKARPTITGVEVSGAWTNVTPKGGTWGNGRAVDVWLTFSEAVDVFYLDKEAWAYTPSVRRTLTLPTVTIETTFGTRTAEWAYAGPATNRLRFRYWPSGDEGFLDEVELLANSLVRNTTRIRSVASGQPAVMTHSGTGSVTPQTLLVSNDDQETGPGYVTSPDTQTETEWRAQGFTTGGDAMTLGGVRLQGRFTDDLEVSIWSSHSTTSGTRPNASLAVLDNPGPLTYYHWLNVSDYYYFRSPGGVQLAANTTYFVVVEEPNPGDQRVRPRRTTTAATGETGKAGWSLADGYFSRTGTGTWGQGDSASLKLSLWGTSGGASGSQSTPGAEQRPQEPFTAALQGLPGSHDGSSAFTVTLRFSREPDTLSYRDIQAGLVFIKGATLTGVRRSVPGSDQAWALTVTPNQTGDVIIRVLPRSCDSTLAFCADGQALTESVFETVAGPDTTPANSEHTGGPTISGTAQVGQTLTANTAAIADADGLTTAVFAYQWIRQDLTTALSENIDGATSATYTVTTADVGSALRVLVTFTDDAGNAEESISQQVTPTAAPDQSQSDTKNAKTLLPRDTPQQAPPAPTELTATANSVGHVVLNWAAPDDDTVTGYVILRRRPTQGEHTLSVYVEDTQNTESTYTDTNVTAGTQHVYRIKAINAAGQSHQSNYANTTPQQPQAPPAPTELTATANSDGHIVLNWDAPDDDTVTGYVILRRRPARGEHTLAVYVEDTQNTDTTYTDTNVTAGTQHVYRIKAINAAGRSHQSNYANTTP